MNVLTAFVDASNVYGSTDTVSNQLRKNESGLLLESSIYPNLLPTIDEVVGYNDPARKGLFVAGDIRVNIMPELTVIHTIWMREHNRIAREIVALKPAWGDERIYQEARRIVSAEMENIVYNEFLPALLGTDTVDQHKLESTSRSTYDSNLDPSVFNGFATAAYRFGHTLVQGLIEKYLNGRFTGTALLRNNFFEPDEIIGNDGRGVQVILEGLMRQPAQAYDRFVTEDLTNFLLRNKSVSSIGEDLLARNIQRGRDHGLPGYPTYRKFCKLSSANSWNQRPREISVENWHLLQTLYRSPKEIDLFVAGLVEDSIPGSILGPTFNCIVAEQFKHFKYGDRYFFSHRDQPGGLTNAQFAEIRRRSFGDVICDVTEILSTQEQVFYLTGQSRSGSNNVVSCAGRRPQNVGVLIGS